MGMGSTPTTTPSLQIGNIWNPVGPPRQFGQPRAGDPEFSLTAVLLLGLPFPFGGARD